MIKLKLTPRQSQVAALILLLTVIALLVSAVAIPTVMLHRRYDEATESATDNLIRFRRFAEQEPAIKEEIEKITALNAKKFFIKTSNPSLAASDIQDAVKQLIEARRGKLLSVQILPAKDEGKYRKVSLTVNANVTPLALQQILLGIESRTPFLFIDNLSIRAGQGRLYRPQPGIDPEFGLQMTLHGYAIINPS
jgi:general secretion pathway protein M